MAERFGAAVSPYLQGAQALFPPTNPYGQVVSNFLLGQAPQAAQQMAAGYPNVLFNTSNPLGGNRIVNPVALDMAFALPVATGLKGAGALAKSAPLVGGITAWHGSPHLFPPTPLNDLGEFNAAKIGSGEGAQAYGHGHYTAEARGTGEGYRRQLSGTVQRPNVEYKGKNYLSGHISGIEGQAVSTIADALAKDIPIADAIKQAREIAKARFARDVKQVRSAGMGVDEFLQSPEEYKALLKQIKATDPSSLKRIGDPIDSGHLYKVDIPDEQIARMLDWDKTLSEQSKHVRDALAKSKNKQVSAMLEYAQTPYSADIGGEAKTMGEAFRLLNLNLHGRSAADSAKASALLAKQGIPGVRYLDAGSRGAGEGTSNFVVFPGNENMMTILERNGQARSVPTQANTLNSRQIRELIDKNSPNESLDFDALRSAIGGNSYELTNYDISKLHAGDLSVDASKAMPSKGAIVIGKDGEIIDGRHRAALAKSAGNTHIQAYTPVAASPESQAIARYREVKGPKSVVRMEAALRTAGVPLPKNEPVAYIQRLVDQAHRRN